MKIEIVPVAEERKSKQELQSIKSTIVVSEKERTTCGQALCQADGVSPSVLSSTTNLEDIFARFLQMEVGDGAASADTIRNYLSQTKQYLNWCRDNLLSPTEAEPEDIKLYRQHLVNSGYANSTIATKLNIVRIFYKAAQAHGLITNNPVAKVKAPKDRKDPAARITFMEAEELKLGASHFGKKKNKRDF